MIVRETDYYYQTSFAFVTPTYYGSYYSGVYYVAYHWDDADIAIIMYPGSNTWECDTHE